jgi:hypothetical protein
MALIEHVIVPALENRSFDHMLGFLDHPDPAFGGLDHGGPYTNPGWAGGPPVPAAPGAKPVLPLGPGTLTTPSWNSWASSSRFAEAAERHRSAAQAGQRPSRT